MNDLTRIAELLKSIGHSDRLRILSLLSQAESDINVTDIYSSLKLNQAVVSQHLIFLRNKGVLNSKKTGKQVFYFIDPTTARVIDEVVSKIFTKEVVQ